MNRSALFLIIQVVIGVLAFFLFLFRNRIGGGSNSAAARIAGATLPKGVVWAPGGGPGVGKCLKCGAPVSYSPAVPGEEAFTCPQCGEKATWGSTPSPR